MTYLQKSSIGSCEITVVNGNIPASSLLESFNNASLITGRGRGGIRIFSVAGVRVLCRQYLHGGLFRAITKDRFFSGRRAADEMEVLLYLDGKGIPVVQPVAMMVTKGFLTVRPYLFTLFEEDGVEMLQYLQSATKKQRRRAVTRLARLLWDLEKAGVYHPDLHISNVMVRGGGSLFLVDFDKAQRKPVTKRDMESIFWRINRFVEKMEGAGRLTVDPLERALFLRAYERASSFSMTGIMEERLRSRRRLARFGWIVEAFLYGRKRQP
jgi:tRNA A-37 threonylcarbamoyl transferase component Bud32